MRRRLVGRAPAASLLAAVLTICLCVASSGATSVRSAIRVHPMRPLTATTCNGDTCQTVSGSGQYVSTWESETTAPDSTCTKAQFFENGTLIAESGSTCLTSGEDSSATWEPEENFPIGAQLCSQWTNIPGKPCDTIE